MSDEHALAKGLMVGGDRYISRNSGQVAITGLILGAQQQRDKSGARVDDFQAELTGEIVAERCRADFGDGKTAGGDHQGGSVKFGGVRAHHELGGPANVADLGLEEDLNSRRATFGFEHVQDVLRRAVAEKLAKSFFVIWDAVLFHQGDEIRRCVAGQRRFRKMGIGGDEVFGLAIKIGEIAASAAGDEDFLAGFVGSLENRDAAAALSGFDGAEETRGSRSEDQGVEVVGHLMERTAWNYTRLGFAVLGCRARRLKERMLTSTSKGGSSGVLRDELLLRIHVVSFLGS